MNYFGNSMSKNSCASGVLCAVQTCKASKRSHPNRKFFQFPKDQILFDIWLEKCGLTASTLPKMTLKICEEHFNTKCIGKRRLTRNSIPELHLSDSNIKTEDEVQSCFQNIVAECYDPTNLQTIHCTNSSVCESLLKKKYIASLSSVQNLTSKIKRFNRMIKYYKEQIKFLENEIKVYRMNKSDNIQIDSMLNLNIMLKDFCQTIFNDANKEWPCVNCRENLKVAVLKENITNSDVNIVETPLSNFESGDDEISINNSELIMTNSNIMNNVDIKNSISNHPIKIESGGNDRKSFTAYDVTNLTDEQFHESSKYLDSGATTTDNDDEKPINVTMEHLLNVPCEKYECEKCGVKKDKYKQLINHLKSHPDINLYECETCGKEFHLGSRYRRHAINHQTDKPFVCKICKKGFKGRGHLMQHKLTHKTEKIHPCSVCDKKFPHMKALRQHLSYHKEKSVLCSICNKKFHYKSQLRMHIEITHEGMDIKLKTESSRKHNNRIKLKNQCTCEKCGKLLASNIILKHHIKTVHNKVKPFACRYCSKAFSLASALNVHIQHHINSKNNSMDAKTIETYLKYKCDECEKAFTSAHFLKYHKIIHSGVKDYICTHCGKAFAFKWYLQRHVRLLHDITNPKNFKCSRCGKISLDVHAFNAHMLSHTKEMPFSCKICGSKFRYAKSLRIHTNNKHKC